MRLVLAMVRIAGINFNKGKMKKNKSKDFNSRKTELVTVGKTKATSSKLEINFGDLPYDALCAAARRFFYGQKRHGRFNWRQGDKAFAEERIKHLINHLFLFNEERLQEDLDAVICNAMMIGWYYSNDLMSKNPVKDFMRTGKDELRK